MSRVLLRNIVVKTSHSCSRQTKCRPAFFALANPVIYKSQSFATSAKMGKSSENFEIPNIFNVKDRVALVTGGGLYLLALLSSAYSYFL